MLIGELGEAVGLSSQTIRFYERTGLVPAPLRAANGYRSYDGSTISRLAFVRTAQAAGLTLVEIRSILDLRDAGQAPCTHVADLIDSKLVDVDRRITEHANLQTELEQLRERSRLLDPADCTDSDICQILTGKITKTPTVG